MKSQDPSVFALIATTVTFAVVSGMGMEEMLSAFTSGMGGTVADIGLVIALGTVTGASGEVRCCRTMAKTIPEDYRREHAALGLAITGTLFPSGVLLIGLQCSSAPLPSV